MKVKAVVVPVLFILIFGCQSAGYESASKKDMDAASADSMAVSSSAAVENNADSSHKFIRTADLKFKVENVVQSTAAVEDITTRQGGFVTYTNLSSDVDNVTTIAVSRDSSLETTYFHVANSMIIRVPNTRLDTTLRELAKTIDYIDYRIIKADDVALQILSNELKTKRSAQNQNRLKKAIDGRISKLGETTTTEEVVYDKQEQADNALLTNRMLADQIRFSTINLNFYQRQALKRELVSNNTDTTAWEPGFGSKLLDSVQYGWQMLEALLVFITKLWAVLLFGLVMYLLYRSYRRTWVK